MHEPTQDLAHARSVRLLDALVVAAAVGALVASAAVLTRGFGPEFMAILWIWALHSIVGAKTRQCVL
jgi:hypothetical protein